MAYAFPSEDELTGLLTKLLRSPLAVDDILNGDPVPNRQYPNVKVGFTPFVNWLKATAYNDIPPHLAGYVQKYRWARSLYQDDVMDYLNSIILRRTGRALFDELLFARPRQVVILPWDKPNQRNATTRAEDPEGATEAGKPQLDSDGDPIDDSLDGMGYGSDSIINYTPNMWQGQGGPAHLPDEIVFHELVHAARQMRGVSYKREVNREYNNMEEYIAVIITNIYLSEKGQHYLRANHAVHKKPDDDELANADGFLDNSQQVDLAPRRLLEQFMTRQFRFYVALSNIPRAVAWFNPIRQMEYGAKDPTPTPPRSQDAPRRPSGGKKAGLIDI